MQESSSSSPVAVFSPSEVENCVYISEGSFSTLYVGYLDFLTVAIKTLKPLEKIKEPSSRQRAQADFENELQLNSKLRHPNIVTLIGCIREQKIQSLVFEYSSRGVPECSSYGPSRITESIELCLGVGSALCYAHRLGIVHRDVKPSQVLMFGDVPKIGDWGLATIVPECGCKSGETGTWEFMAPEVIRCDPYFEAADVYSFGVLIFCFVTGTSYPYRGNYLTPAQAAIGVVKNGLRPHLSERIPGFISNIITSCWKGDQKSRPKMTQVLKMLQESQKFLVRTSRGSSVKTWFSWIWEA